MAIPADQPTPELDARRELAEVARGLLDAIVRTRAAPARLEEVTEQLRHARKALDGDLRTGPYTPDPQALETDATPFPFNPVVGPANPLAPPVTFDVEGDDVVGRATLGTVYEGPPGYVHGGITCMILDQALGLANLAAGTPGLTANLDVDYRAPTPLHTDLRVESRCLGADGRKVRAEGRILAGETVCVEAAGLFLQISPEQAEAIFAEISDPGD